MIDPNRQAGELSADGQFYWNGTGWALLAPPGKTSSWANRQPTSWTRQLQLAVTGWYVWSILWALMIPLLARWLVMSELNREFASPAPSFGSIVASMGNLTLWAQPMFNSALFAVLIAGTWKAWRWTYYVVLVLLGLTALSLPLDLIQPVVHNLLRTASVITMPTWFYLSAFVAGLPAVALFVWMLVALIKRGPWAMRRPQLY